MLALYSDLPFVLIGDSGQHDPEVYHDIVAENPGRVLAVYIRNVSRQPERVNQIEKLAVALAEAGSSLVLAADSFAMAEHALGLGLIAPGALDEIGGEINAANSERDRAGTRPADRPTVETTAGSIAQAGLQEVLKEGTETPNVVVEGEGPGGLPARDG